MRVLVTGGSGYLGSVLVPLLLDQGYCVRNVDIRRPVGLDSLKRWRDHPELQVMIGDLKETHVLKQCLRGVDCVIHLAALSSNAACNAAPDLARLTNHDTTLALAKNARTANVRRFIFVSSCAVYSTREAALLSEESETNPLSLYAQLKLETERDLSKLNGDRLRVFVLRLASLYGASPSMRLDLVLNRFVADALSTRCLFVNGGYQCRPFLHVADAARACTLFLGDRAGRQPHNLFNVGATEQNYQVIEVARITQEIIVGTRTTVRPNLDLAGYQVSFERLRQTFGYTSIIGIRDGIRELRDRLTDQSAQHSAEALCRRSDHRV